MSFFMKGREGKFVKMYRIPDYPIFYTHIQSGKNKGALTLSDTHSLLHKYIADLLQPANHLK